MTITVKYFASLAEELGRREDRLEAAGPESAATLWQRATGRAHLPASTLVARNHEYVGPDERVSDGDEVAYFPPVTGG